jgi:hypothetical protein
LAGFKAEGVVEALDYDFNPFVKAEGTIPEPTDRQIADFLGDLKDLFTEVKDDLPQGIDTDDPGMVLAAMNDIDTEVTIKMTDRMCGIYSKLCSGTPTEKQIHDLPPRIRQVFFAWLQGEVMSPEAVTGGGQAQVTPLRGARAG